MLLFGWGVAIVFALTFALAALANSLQPPFSLVPLTPTLLQSVARGQSTKPFFLCGNNNEFKHQTKNTTSLVVQVLLAYSFV